MSEHPLQSSGGYSFSAAVVLAVAVVLASACGGSNPENVPPDERFGHRYEGEGPAERQTVIVTPPEEEQSYNYYTPYIDSLHVRPAPFAEGVPASEQKVPVEILIKAAFINGCSELGRADPERSGNTVNVDFKVRWPKGEVCAKVKRPFRFYLRLPGRYGPGNYTVKINDEDYAFSIETPS
jgi:hypothetical protein